MKIKQKIIKILPLLVLLAILIPILTYAAGLVPDCGPYNECGFGDLIKLVDGILNWIVIISTPVSAGVFAWAGFLYMTSSVVDQKAKAKKMMWNVFWGFVFILSAWLIVTTIYNTLVTNPEFKSPVQLGK